MNRLPHFRFWCQKVLPLVYDDSLSYYEVLCKVVKYINKLIDDDKIMADEISDLQNEVSIIQEWIDNFDTSHIRELIEKELHHMIFVGINDAGYIVYYIPDGWDEIIFNTTGLDISIPDYDYGHLVLSFNVGGV